MGSKLADAVAAMQLVNQHLNAATINLSCFHRLGFNALDLPSHPQTQCAALEATISELRKAVRRMKAVDWPTEEECGKL